LYAIVGSRKQIAFLETKAYGWLMEKENPRSSLLKEKVPLFH
jgi:hypothetical protein